VSFTAVIAWVGSHFVSNLPCFMILGYILFITSMVLKYLSFREIVMTFSTDTSQYWCCFHVEDSRYLQRVWECLWHSLTIAPVPKSLQFINPSHIIPTHSSVCARLYRQLIVSWALELYALWRIQKQVSVAGCSINVSEEQVGIHTKKYFWIQMFSNCAFSTCTRRSFRCQ